MSNTHAANKTIAVHDRIPAGLKLQEKPVGADSPSEVDLDAFFKGRKIVIFGLPGAFTPGCTKTHLPGYVTDFEKLKSKGVAEIACIATNDAWVLSAWGAAHKAEGKVRMLSDASGAFSRALGVALEVPGALTLRTKRFSAVVEDGVITQINVEADGMGLTCSLSSALKL